MKRTAYRLIILSLAIILSATLAFCEDNAEKKKMSEEEFIEIYVQLSIAAEQYLAKPDSLTVIQDSIFATSGFTSDDFNDFREKIDSNPEKWNNIWQKIVDKISAISEEKDKDSSKEKSNEDKK